METKILDWNKLSTDKKKSLSEKENLTFIVGGREMSNGKIKRLIEAYGVEDNYLLFGVLKELFIPELESEQFKSLRLNDVAKVIENTGLIGIGKVRILEHRQEDTSYIISELKPSKVIFIQGSYKRAIHLRDEYWRALDVEAEIKLESCFLDEKEALNYERKIKSKKNYKFKIDKYKIYTDKELIELSNEASRRSFDWTGQVGAILAYRGKPKIISYNSVLPFETYSLLNGSLREKFRSPAGDQNYYDTNHAEMEIIEQARRRRIGLRGKTLYVNIFPCPTCARILSRTEISKIIYSVPHSDFTGMELLKRSGIEVEQVSQVYL